MSLPNETWLQIIGYLGSSDLKTLRCVNYAFNNLTSASVVTNLFIEVDYLHDLSSHMEESSAQRLTGFTRSLTLSYLLAVDHRYSDRFSFRFAWNLILDGDRGSDVELRRIYEAFFDGLDELKLLLYYHKTNLSPLSREDYRNAESFVHAARNVRTLNLSWDRRGASLPSSLMSHHWHKLQDLTLSRLMIERDSLINFLLRHKQTLAIISFTSVVIQKGTHEEPFTTLLQAIARELRLKRLVLDQLRWQPNAGEIFRGRR